MDVKRRNKPCHECRSKRMRCDIEERASQGLSCSRCTKLRLSCLVDHVNSPRVHNERSELQVQIERMQDIVGKVATDEGTDDFDASELDLVGALTKLCFTPQSHTSRLIEGKDVVEASKAVLRQDDAAHARMFGITAAGNSFGIDDDLTDATIEDLVALLPTPERAVRVTSWAQSKDSFSGAYDLIYSPVAADNLSRMFTAEMRTSEDLRKPSLLAEMHALMVFYHMDWLLEAGEDGPSWTTPQATEDRKRRSTIYANAAKRALVLADYTTSPDLHCLRALHSLQSLYGYIFPSTEHISQGLAFGTVGLSLAQSLDMHREDLECRKTESALERYDRRAVLSGLVRAQWTTHAALGRPPLSSASLLDIPPPEYLHDADLPEYLRGLHRPGPDEYLLLRLRHELCQATAAIALELAPGSRISMRVIQEHSDALDRLAARVPSRYAYHYDAEGRTCSNVVLTDARDLMLKMSVNNSIQLAKVSLHRVSLCLAKAQGGSGPLLQHHQAELLRYSRQMLAEHRDIVTAHHESFVHFAASTFLYYSFLVAALAVYWEVDESAPGRSLFREEALTTLAALDPPETRYTLPSSARRLIAILKLLLERPRVKAAERSSTSAQGAGKRMKAAFDERPSSYGLPAEELEAVRAHKQRTAPLAASITSSIAASSPSSSGASLTSSTAAPSPSSSSAPLTRTPSPPDLVEEKPLALAPFSFDFSMPSEGVTEMLYTPGGIDWSSFLRDDAL